MLNDQPKYLIMKRNEMPWEKVRPDLNNERDNYEFRTREMN